MATIVPMKYNEYHKIFIKQNLVFLFLLVIFFSFFGMARMCLLVPQRHFFNGLKKKFMTLFGDALHRNIPNNLNCT